MNFGQAISSVFRKYATFSGRARRSEFWFFFLFNALVYLFLSAVSFSILYAGVGIRNFYMMRAALGRYAFVYVLYIVYTVGTIVPVLALTCRRLHDTNRSGVRVLFALIPVVGWVFLLIWTLQEGDYGPNPYGPDPKQFSPVITPVRQQQYVAPRPAPRPAAANAYGAGSGNNQQPRETVTFYLEGTAGCFVARRIAIRGTLSAGRHPDCGIRFPADTHGVSHRHCLFHVSGATLTVTDTDSSFGTFINDKKLRPNQPAVLYPGDVVQLGSRKQSFRVM